MFYWNYWKVNNLVLPEIRGCGTDTEDVVPGSNESTDVEVIKTGVPGTKIVLGKNAQQRAICRTRYQAQPDKVVASKADNQVLEQIDLKQTGITGNLPMCKREKLCSSAS